MNELFYNKKIAVVGPSPHLLGSKMGEKIDSYDLVCRLNEVRPKGLEQDYGSRSDVLFWHLNNCDKKDFISHYENDMETFNKIKLLVYPRQHDDVNRRGCGKSTPLQNATNWFPQVPFYQVDTNRVKKWEDEYGAHFTVGTLCLLSILECKFSELFVCGMSFYLHGGKKYHHAHPTHPHQTGTVHEMHKDISCLRKRFYNISNVSGDEYFTSNVLT